MIADDRWRKRTTAVLCGPKQKKTRRNHDSGGPLVQAGDRCAMCVRLSGDPSKRKKEKHRIAEDRLCKRTIAVLWVSACRETQTKENGENMIAEDRLRKRATADVLFVWLRFPSLAFVFCFYFLNSLFMVFCEFLCSVFIITVVVCGCGLLFCFCLWLCILCVLLFLLCDFYFILLFNMYCV